MRSSARGASAAGSRWANCCPSGGAPVMTSSSDDGVAQRPHPTSPTVPPSCGARSGRSGTSGRGLRRAEGADSHVVALPAHSVSRRCTPDLAFQLGEPEKRIAPPLGDDLGIAHADPSERAMCSRSSGGWRMNRPRSSSKTSWSPLIRQGPRTTWASVPVSQEPGAGGAPGHERVLVRKYHGRKKGVGARGDEISSGCLPMKSAMVVMWGLSEHAPVALAPRSTRAAGTLVAGMAGAHGRASCRAKVKMRLKADSPCATA
jgi:hypothetical protein